MNTDQRRLRTMNLSWHYRCSSAFICGQIAFFSTTLGQGLLDDGG